VTHDPSLTPFRAALLDETGGIRIAKVDCEFLVVPVTIPVRETQHDYGFLLVTLETDTGIRGTGFAREHDFQAQATRQSVLNDIGPLLMSMGGPKLVPGYFWHEATYELPRDYRATTGVVSRAVSAVDQALWDIWGQMLGQPVYRLLGGSQPEIEFYATYGLYIYNAEEEVEAARRLREQGFTAFKIQGANADRGRDTAHDAGRVRRLRETVGDDARIILDGRNNYSVYQAIELARMVEPYNMAYFDEPVYARDPDAFKRFKQAVPWMPVAGRGRDGNIFDNRDLIVSGAIDVVGVNVLDQGGYTQAIKVAHLAEAYHLPLVTGGAWYFQNAHLIAAATNGWMTEYHAMATAATEMIFHDTIKPEGGRLRLSEKPGLGLRLNDEAVEEAKERARFIREGRL
jgi:L-alanine-DL-glutamate epimerase-like enolase superfamily enzyme